MSVRNHGIHGIGPSRPATLSESEPDAAKGTVPSSTEEELAKPDAAAQSRRPDAAAVTHRAAGACGPTPAVGLRPHLGHSPATRADVLSAFNPAFHGVIGPDAVHDLIAAVSPKPVVLLAGDQLTGKSTAARSLARALGGQAGGTGSVVRKMAEERGLTIEAMSAALREEPSTDVYIDYRAATMIARGDCAALESRLAGHLGQYLRGLGKTNILSVYLTCSPKERVLRYLSREVSAEARRRIEPKLRVPAGAEFMACLEALSSTGDIDALRVASHCQEIAARDHNDCTRLQALYGIDYRDRSSFDVVIDTSDRGPDQVLAELLTVVQTHFPAAIVSQF